MTRKELLAEAKTWAGSPYHHQGRLKGVGVDCVGLVMGLASFAGVPFKDEIVYDAKGGGADLLAELGKYLTRKDTPPLPADVLVFATIKEGFANHVGIMTASGRLLHTSARSRRVVEHFMDAELSRRLLAVYSFPGLED